MRAVICIHCLLHSVTLTSRAAARAQLVTQRTPVARLLQRMTEAERRTLAAMDEEARRDHPLGGVNRRADARPMRARDEDAQSIRERYHEWKREWKERLKSR